MLTSCLAGSDQMSTCRAERQELPTVACSCVDDDVDVSSQIPIKNICSLKTYAVGWLAQMNSVQPDRSAECKGSSSPFLFVSLQLAFRGRLQLLMEFPFSIMHNNCRYTNLPYDELC